MNDEQAALIAFIELRPKCNILREIAERRLVDIKEWLELNQYQVRAIPDIDGYIHKPSKKWYKSLSEACLKRHIKYNSLLYDITKKRYNFQIYPVETVVFK